MELAKLTNKELEELNDEIIRQIVIDDLEYYTSQGMKDMFITNILGKIDTNDNIIDILVNEYKKGSPYVGYYQKYLLQKEKILREKFDIEFDVPNENNIVSID